MDQQPDNIPSVAPIDNAETTKRVNEQQSRRADGENAIDRIAASARALDDSERAVQHPGSASPDAARRASRTALIPAPAVVHRTREPATASAPAPKATRMPAHLPIYAAALCLALGVGGVFGGQLATKGESTVADAETTKIERALPWKREVAEVQVRDTAKVRDDLRSLRGEIAALRANNDQLRQAEGQKQVQELRALRTTLEAQKAETASLKADLAARFDRADRDATQRTDKAAERIDRLEKRLTDPVVTGSIAKAAPEPAKPVAEPAKPEKQPVRGIVLRDVSQGVALIETRRGLMEVMPGDPIPGAGRVEAIEKHAGKWRVVTTTGIIDDRLE